MDAPGNGEMDSNTRPPTVVTPLPMRLVLVPQANIKPTSTPANLDV